MQGMYRPHSSHILPPMERNKGGHLKCKHQNKEDRREDWGAKGNPGVEGPEAGLGRVSDVNEQGLELGDEGEGGKGGAGIEATQTDIRCHEADATSVRWLDQTG